MHRRTLTVRRFGPMSFGLGYFEDGVWVDHTIPDADGVQEFANGSALPAHDEPMDVVHQWFTCCSDPISERQATQVNIAVVVPERHSHEPPGLGRPAAWEAPTARTRAQHG